MHYPLTGYANANEKGEMSFGMMLFTRCDLQAVMLPSHVGKSTEKTYNKLFINAGVTTYLERDTNLFKLEYIIVYI